MAVAKVRPPLFSDNSFALLSLIRLAKHMDAPDRCSSMPKNLLHRRAACTPPRHRQSPRQTGPEGSVRAIRANLLLSTENLNHENKSKGNPVKSERVESASYWVRQQWPTSFRERRKEL